MAMFKDFYVNSGLVVVKSLVTLQQIWISAMKLIARGT